MSDVLYKDGQVLHIGDTFKHGNYDFGSYHYKVSKTTPQRVYYKLVEKATGNPHPWDTGGFLQKYAMNQYYLVVRGAGYKKPPSSTGFAAFVRKIEAPKKRKSRKEMPF